MNEFNWTCPFCQNAQTVSDNKYAEILQQLYVGENKHGLVVQRLFAIGCSNPKCKDVSIVSEIGIGSRRPNGNLKFDDAISTHRLRPDSFAKPLPGFVPKPITEDYTEACKIRDLSPKASATLSRRCLQGMIRDFCGISKSRLIDEIRELRVQAVTGKAASGVTLESVEAIDSVREVGNIGAHMEKDIDVIVDVDPNEAQALIELIEMLIDEWYVAREVRNARLAKVKAIADEKKQLKNNTGETPQTEGG